MLTGKKYNIAYTIAMFCSMNHLKIHDMFSKRDSGMEYIPVVPKNGAKKEPGIANDGLTILSLRHGGRSMTLSGDGFSFHPLGKLSRSGSVTARFEHC